MYALVNILNGVPAVPGVPVLNPENLSPVFPVAPESEALDHFVFGGDIESLTGLKGLLTLSPANAAPSFSDSSLATVAGGLNGLTSNLPEPDVYTQCAVIRYQLVDTDRKLVFGTVQGGSGDGKGIMLNYQESWNFSVLARPNSAATGMPQGAVVGAREGWIFAALAVDSVANKWKVYVGGASQIVEVTPASAYQKSTRGLALGNAYYTAAAPNTYTRSLSAAEMIVFEGYLSNAELADVYARSKARMAERGITVY